MLIVKGSPSQPVNFFYSYLLWLHPIIEITFKAVLLCKLQCSTASAITNPPINISIVSFMYIMHVVSVSWCVTTPLKILFQMPEGILTRMPRTGNSTIGIIEVIGKGNASVTQYTDISSTTYIHLNCCKSINYDWVTEIGTKNWNCCD